MDFLPPIPSKPTLPSKFTKLNLRWKQELTQELQDLIVAGSIKSTDNADFILSSNDPIFKNFKYFDAKKVQQYLLVAFAAIQRKGSILF